MSSSPTKTGLLMIWPDEAAVAVEDVAARPGPAPPQFSGLILVAIVR